MPTQSSEFNNPEIAPSKIIGASLPRIDGPLKTTGSARYASDYNFANMVYAVPVCATIANGKIRSLDTSAAEKMPGVLLVLHHDNIGPLFRFFGQGRNSEGRPPLEDNVISYWGQYVALAVAETLQQAQAAAGAVQVQYDAEPPNVSTELENESETAHTESKRGDPDSAFTSAPVQLDELYGTPVETHNPMEMHATVAYWDGKGFTLYESSQGVVNHQHVMAQVMGVEKPNVRVISRYIGSGFGGKLFPWPHSALAAAASRQLRRPVKLTLSRRMMFTDVGHRPETRQRMRLGATRDGKLLSLRQDYRNHTSMLDNIRENCGEATPFLYSTANLQVTSALVKRNVGTPSPMRGPGAVPGLFAVESAMDELAIKLQMDPVELRHAQRYADRRGEQQAIFLSPPEGVLSGRREEVRLVAAHTGGRIDAQGGPHPGLGHGRCLLGGGARSLSGQRHSQRRWLRLRQLRHSGYRHRHLHCLRPGRPRAYWYRALKD